MKTELSKFALGDMVKTETGFIGKIVEAEWLTGQWIYKIDDGTRLVGCYKYAMEHLLERHYTETEIEAVLRGLSIKEDSHEGKL